MFLLIAPLLHSNAFAQSDSGQLGVSEPEAKKSDGTRLMQIRTDSQILLSVTIENIEGFSVPYVAIIEVRDHDGFTSYLQYQKGVLQSSSSTEIGISWIPEKSGEYDVRTFMLSDFANPIILHQ
jgi:hypothetical protein